MTGLAFDELMNRLGYELRVLVPGEVFELTTPLTLPGGAPVRIRLGFGRNNVVLDDGGEILLEAAGMGLGHDPDFEQELARRVRDAGVQFVDGTISVTSGYDDLPSSYAAFLKAVFAVIDLVRNRKVLRD